MAERNFCINGRFLSQELSGVQRYAREIVRALDSGDGVLPDTRWTLICPPGSDKQFLSNLRSIEVRHTGPDSIAKLPRGLRGHFWEQFVLASAARNKPLLNLCNSAPVLHSQQLVIIHDAAVFQMPNEFNFFYGLWHRTLAKLLAKRAVLGTVSNFSRAELASILCQSLDDIHVIPNGSEHLGKITPDASVLSQLRLDAGNFFLTVGNKAKYKNTALVCDAFASLPRQTRGKLVVVGGNAGHVFRASSFNTQDDVLFPGRIADEQLAALYLSASALIFASRYEGFGVPPLEALSFGCPVIASRSAAVVEICGESVDYFSENDVAALTAAMAKQLELTKARPTLQQRTFARVKDRYSWAAGARQIAVLLKELADGAVDVREFRS